MVQREPFMELDSDTSIGNDQDVATVSGARYELSFRYWPRPGTPK